MAHFYHAAEEKKKIRSKIDNIHFFCIAFIYVVSVSLFLFFRPIPEPIGASTFTYWTVIILSNGLAALIPTLLIGMFLSIIGDSFEEDKISDTKKESIKQWIVFLHEEGRTLNEMSVLKQHHLATLSLQEIKERIQIRNEVLLKDINLQHNSFDRTCPCCTKTFKLNLFGMYTACDCDTVKEMKSAKY